MAKRLLSCEKLTMGSAGDDPKNVMWQYILLPWDVQLGFLSPVMHRDGD